MAWGGLLCFEYVDDEVSGVDVDGVSADYYGKVGRRHRNAAYRGLLATA